MALTPSLPVVAPLELITSDHMNGIRSNLIRLDGLLSTSAPATIATGNMSGEVKAFRARVDGADDVVFVIGAGSNAKGSAWAASDGLFTIPAGYRPVSGVLIAWNMSTIQAFSVSVDATSGAVSYSLGATVTAGQVAQFDFMYTVGG